MIRRASGRILLASALLGTGFLAPAHATDATPTEESRIAEQVISRLGRRDYVAIEQQLDSTLRSPNSRTALAQLADIIPLGESKSMQTVGSRIDRRIGADNFTAYEFSLEYEYPQTWLQATVFLKRHDGHLSITGIHLNTAAQSLEESNRFTFDGKGPLHGMVLALCLLVPLFILHALIQCLRTPLAKRKWLWCLFIVFGLVQLSLNWTTGEWNIEPLRFLLLGAGFMKASSAAPLMLAVSIPVGAITFLIKRKNLPRRSAPTVE
ncbi:hypothetical protein BH09PSE6_BH09PSE6_01810 [soil metagenome]